MEANLLYFAVALTLVIYVIGSKISYNHTSPLPPGPKGLPIIGHLLSFPKEWQTFQSLSKSYGDVMHFSLMGQPIIVLSSWKAAKDLLENKAKTYSDRAHTTMAGVLVGWNEAPILQNGDNHRAMRKLMRTIIGESKFKEFRQNMEEVEIHRFLKKLLDWPEKWEEHVRWIIGDFILRISYGYHCKEDNDPFIANAKRVLAEFSEAIEPGAWIVDFIPILRFLPAWTPGVKFIKQAKYYSKSKEDVIQLPYYETKSRYQKEAQEPNFVVNALEDVPEPVTVADEKRIMWTAMALYSGGADTTVSAMVTFFLVMALNPAIQMKAQREIDEVVGKENRLPGFKDTEQLPYINAMVKEVLRYGSVVPLGIPHLVKTEDTYRGMRLPAGALVMVNIKGILSDPENYPDPEVFRPERFIGENSQLDPRIAVFGYGLRRCPGDRLSEETIYLIVVSTLALFNITFELPEKPERITYPTGIITHPEKFPISIKPRSEKLLSLLST